MNRRTLLASALAGAAPSLALAQGRARAAAASAPFRLNYAPHFGMFANHAGQDLLAQLRFMRAEGFRALEDNGLMGRPVEMQSQIGAELARLDMQMGVFVVQAYKNGDVWAVTGDKTHRDHFVATCRQAVETAKRVNAKWMTVVPGGYDRRLPIGVQTANVIDVLRFGAEIFEPHGLVMVLEPLSDTPDLFLQQADQTFEICRAVNSPSCKVLYDIYHMQRNRGHLLPMLDLVWSETAYLQVGDNPGRKEPGTGEINYRNVFRHVHAKGFTGVIGMEHGNAFPGREGERRLIEAYRQADAF
jgi:hydroxypyruvate isomerase